MSIDNKLLASDVRQRIQGLCKAETLDLERELRAANIIMNLTLGTNLLNIGSNAFYQCSSLTTLTLPASIQTIGDGAFDQCGDLEYVNFNGTNLSTIGVDAFQDCYKVTGISLPSSLGSIGAGASGF